MSLRDLRMSLLHGITRRPTTPLIASDGPARAPGHDGRRTTVAIGFASLNPSPPPPEARKQQAFLRAEPQGHGRRRPRPRPRRSQGSGCSRCPRGPCRCRPWGLFSGLSFKGVFAGCILSARSQRSSSTSKRCFHARWYRFCWASSSLQVASSQVHLSFSRFFVDFSSSRMASPCSSKMADFSELPCSPPLHCSFEHPYPTSVQWLLVARRPSSYVQQLASGTPLPYVAEHDQAQSPMHELLGRLLLYIRGLVLHAF